MVNIELETISQPSEESVILKCSQTRAFYGQQEIGSAGDLFICTDCVSWIDAAGNGFTLLYPTIALHGTSRDLEAFPHPCIYLMLDGKMPGVTLTREVADDEGNEDDEGDDDSDGDPTELRFVPCSNGPTLEDLYAAFSRGQSLNPDPNSNSEDSEEGAEYDCQEDGWNEEHENGGNGHNQFEDGEEANDHAPNGNGHHHMDL